jgi:SOS-response transcriptional repressor LexA/transcriptional regulator with XRE-family HTH domain
MGLEQNLKELEALRRLLAATEKSDAFGKEVRLARTQRGMTLESLAAATGMAKSYLSQIETGYAPPPRDEKVRRIAEAIGLDPEMMMARAHLSQLPDDVRARIARLMEVFDSTEEVIRALLAASSPSREPKLAGTPDGGEAVSPSREPKLVGTPDEGDGSEAEASPAPEADAAIAVDLEALRRSGLLQHLAKWGDEHIEAHHHDSLKWIPIINKVPAGFSQGFTDLDYPAGIADDYIPTPPGLSDPNAFALRVDGDSMEPKYHAGDLVIFSPAAAVASGNDCFVRFGMTGGPMDDEITFKRVFFDAVGEIRLQPLNERYAPKTVKPSEIAKIVRAVTRYERL